MRISYLIKQAFRELKDRWGFNLALVVCIASSFLILGSFLLITSNLDEVKQRLKGEVQIEVYLNDDVTSLQLHLLLQSIKRSCEVEKIEFRSKQKALVQLESYLGKDVLQGLDTNPLPASFLLSLKKKHRGFEQVTEIASRFKNMEGVEDVEFGGTWLRKLDRAVFIFSMVDVIFGILILSAVILIVSYFMKVVVLFRTESMQIMSLMGASDLDILFPLLIQGLLLGAAGAWLGVLFLWGGYVVFTRCLLSITFLSLHMILGLIVGGMILGAGGSFLSIRKHLKIQSLEKHPRQTFSRSF